MLTPFELGLRFLGLKELPGDRHAPVIQWGFELCGWDEDTADEVAWCSAWAQIPAHLASCLRSRSARARSWLAVGATVDVGLAKPGFDVVVLKRGQGPQPGPNDHQAPGHVGYFAGFDGERIFVLGGNQSDEVNITPYHVTRLLGVQRIGGTV